ncbi:2-phosphoglycerate kinase [Cryptosporidium canis]|uniref:2-phosphoglycerate kinase n=1 Tax=Cryptosporidium canis TaxID=195482 RepID=A0ABQ8PB03_9CRYT|nr:2-phosphoglycerate kinase [Cryptosporidium canis]KAJ1614318.1 2-phosphoglycerate kinase [Cryptosporidium canis]
MCQVYDKDQIDRVMESLSERGFDEDQDELLDLLARKTLLVLSRDILKSVRVMREIFTSRLAIVPLIFGIQSSNKSPVMIDLAYYLNIPNIVSTDTVKETLRIYKGRPRSVLGDDRLSYSDYLVDSREVSKGVQVDIEKAIRQGKSIILCGHNLFLPYIFELHSSGLFPAPTSSRAEQASEGVGKGDGEAESPAPLYYLPSPSEDLINLLFVPILLKADLKKTRVDAKTKRSLELLQDEIISNTLNNTQNWPLHLVVHNPDNPQTTSRTIHQIIIKSLQEIIPST